MITFTFTIIIIIVFGQLWIFDQCTGHCSDEPFLQGICSTVIIDEQPHVTLTFALNTSCGRNHTSAIKHIALWHSPISLYPICRAYYHRTGFSCHKLFDCRACNVFDLQWYSVTWRIRDVRSGMWRLNGTLWNGAKVQEQVVKISGKVCSLSVYEPVTETTEQTRDTAPSSDSASLHTSEHGSLQESTESHRTETIPLSKAPSSDSSSLYTSEYGSRQESTESHRTEGIPLSKVSKETGASLGDVERYVIILLGVTGCVVCVVIIMAVLLAVLFKKRNERRCPSHFTREEGFGSELPLPPPVRHNVTRKGRNDVMLFHSRSSPVLKDVDSYSLTSQMSHLYSEIPDNASVHHLSSATLSSLSDSVSDITWSDSCLRHIACPSSDSSGSAGYLDLVESDEESKIRGRQECVTQNAVQDDYLHPQVPSSKTATACTASTPNNGTNTQRSLTQNTVQDDYLHPVVSSSETATASTFSTSNNGTTTMQWPLTQNTVHDDYLHPVVSSLETPTASTTLTLKNRSKQQSSTQNTVYDDYLHPLVSLSKTATASTTSTLNNTGKQQSLTQNTSNDDYRYPVVSSSETKTASTVESA